MLNKRNIIILTIMAILSIAGWAYADSWFDTEPTPINIAHNPISINGTYDIERLIIEDGENIILDSEDDYIVDEDRGEVTIRFDPEKQSINVSFKMQMKGYAFKKGGYLEKYSFIYDNRLFKLSDPINFETVGIAVYTHKYVKFTTSIDGNKTLILFLEKDSDKAKDISNSKYLFL